MKNKIYIAGILFTLSLCVQGVAQAVTINSSFDLNINCDQSCQDDGLTLFRYKGKITETVHKTVNFVTESDTNTPQSFILNLDESVSMVSTPTTGDWFVTGGQYDSPPSDGIMYEVLRTKIDGHWDTFQIGTSIPQDENNFVLESEDPDIVSCEDNVCRAVAGGTTNVIVSFPDSTQVPGTYTSTCKTKKSKNSPFKSKKTSSCEKTYEINGSEIGYGKILFKAKDISQKKGTHDSAPILMTYSFPSITYTVTVPDTSNDSQLTACSGITNITTSGATINWTYSDPDNDPQTNYAIDIATDANFNDIVAMEIAPDNTDVSAVRSLAISGLEPNTTYYARVQSYNDTNDWSDYASCRNSFTTIDGPVDGFCGEDLNTCEDGIVQTTGINQWICKGKNNGVDSTTCTYSLSTSTSSCTPSDTVAVIGDEITYTVDSEDAIYYKWMDNLGNFLFGGADADTYSYTYAQPGIYSRRVEVTKADNTKEMAYCSAVRVDNDCGPQPDDEADECSIDGSMRSYECVNGAWVLGAPTECDPIPELVDDVDASGSGPGHGVAGGGFHFNPSLVPVGGFCKLFVHVKNAKVCKLVNQSNQDIPLVNTVSSPYFKVDGANRAVGVYKLYCKATTTPARAFTQLGPSRSCYSSPNVNEN